MMDFATYTQEQYDAEFALFKRSANYELTNTERALTMMRLLNTSEQEARLAAVKAIRKQRRARA